jgi:hypothetical protein
LFAIYAVRVLERLTLGLLTMWTLLLMVMLLSCGLLTLLVIVNGAISLCKIWSENLVKIWLKNLVKIWLKNLAGTKFGTKSARDNRYQIVTKKVALIVSCRAMFSMRPK